jgi:hypothetical protein
VAVELAPAGDRALAADVEGGERVQLPVMRHAGDHPELRRHGRIGGRCLHAAGCEGRPPILVEIRQEGRRREGVSRKAQRQWHTHLSAVSGGTAFIPQRCAADQAEGAMVHRAP